MAISSALKSTSSITTVLGKLLRVLSKVAIIFPRSLKPTVSRDPKVHPTIYLDALRGYAAWIVWNAHFCPKRWKPVALNFLFAGTAMVDIFFVISGFVLSYQVLGYMHSAQTGRILDSLASSVFRRYFRLYLPCVFATFVAMLGIASGITIHPTDPKIRQPTFLANLTLWISDTARACDPFHHVLTAWFNGVFGFRYLGQLWTIPLEFRGSLVLFLFCISVCKMTPWARRLTIVGGSMVCLWYETVFMALFLAGMALADSRQWRASERRQQQHPQQDGFLGDLECNGNVFATADTIKSEGERDWLDGTLWPRITAGYLPSAIKEPGLRGQLLRELPSFFLIYIAYVLLSGPVYCTRLSAFPYNVISRTIPPTYGKAGLMHWPLFFGATLLCYALEHSPLLQGFLTTSFSQYIGELSFGIYAMHEIIRWTIWLPYLARWQMNYFGREPEHTTIQYWFPGYFVSTILVLWLAEGFRRVDVQCVRLTRALQARTFRE